MKKIKFLFTMIVLGIVIFAIDDKHIVKDINLISYTDSHVEQIANSEFPLEESVLNNEVEEKNESVQNVITEQKNTNLSNTDKKVNNTKPSQNEEEHSSNNVTTKKNEPTENKAESKQESSQIASTTTQNNELNYIEKLKNNNDKLGTVGRLYMPSVNLDVAVYHAQAFENAPYTAQEIVDRKDSAAYYKGAGKYIIADHNYQGFSKINNINTGDKAYIKNVDGTITILTAKARFLGQNLKTDLVDQNGNSVYFMDCDIIMYTCYKDSTKNIMITLWKIA